MAVLDMLAQGIYSFLVTDKQGCFIEDSVQIWGINCNYLSVGSNGSTEYFVGDLEQGNYQLLLTDSLGCVFSDNYTLRNGGEIEVGQIIQPASDAQTPDASINISVSGGASPYQFYWSNGTINEDLNNVFHGVYWLSITDSLNCQALLTNIEVGYWQNCEDVIIETPDIHFSSNFIQAQNFIQSNRIISNNELLQYKAGSFIELTNDFEVLQGGIFEARIDACE